MKAWLELLQLLMSTECNTEFLTRRGLPKSFGNPVAHLSSNLSDSVVLSYGQKTWGRSVSIYCV